MKSHLFLLFIFIISLNGCRITERYNEYSVRVNNGYDGFYFYSYKNSVKIILNHSITKVKIKYSDITFVYNIENYKYIYDSLDINGTIIGIVIETKCGLLIKIVFNEYTYVDIPSLDNYDLTDTLLWFYIKK